MVKLALYKKRGNWINWLIRWRTHSPYSHCELVVDGWCYSSSGRDGGVRAKQIDLSEGWDVVDVPWAWVNKQDVLDFFAVTSGCRYDYLGVIVGAVFGTKTNKRNRWFCSEWCAEALGMAEPWRWTPASLGAIFSAPGSK
jgi:hypothetical protein